MSEEEKRAMMAEADRLMAAADASRPGSLPTQHK